VTSVTGSEPDGSAPLVLEDRIAAMVLAVPGVAGLHGGMFGEAATYLPGRRVSGIRTSDTGTEIHVSVVYGAPVAEIAQRVRLAVAGLAPQPVGVTVEDVVAATARTAGAD